MCFGPDLLDQPSPVSQSSVLTLFPLISTRGTVCFGGVDVGSRVL